MDDAARETAEHRRRVREAAERVIAAHAAALELLAGASDVPTGGPG